MINLAFLLSFFLIFIVGIVYTIYLKKFLARLKGKHNKIWVDLGSFAPFLNNSFSNSTAVLKYILTNKARETGDDVLIRYSSVTRALLIASFMATAAFLFIASRLPKTH